jgi:serine/threonine-protein kinase
MTDAPFPLDGATEVRGESAATPPPTSTTRFAPGMLLAERYRIVAQLGRGGMGEVYRADDLKLGHPVALKFLPRELAADRTMLERLIAEVRIGRQVSHPNVCRLYDIVEWQGTHFLAMEYVDGEDLASLLRRIGRLPPDKALDIAHDLAAGLSAAHDLGVVHRDLKPANVMVDGRGRAKITDFGLAAIAGDPSARGIAGTPAYMAPEQLRGEPVTPRSDLYALGLILFEVFTGRRLFEGGSLQEVISRRSATKTPSVSSIVRDVDPVVERVIARCLDDDPAARPPSARAIIASLPGGDPLAAALAAGETPSPEMVAAAGEVGDLRPAIAWPAFVVAVVALLAVGVLAMRSTIFGHVKLPKSTEVLQARAQDIAEHLGYTTPFVDVAGEWGWNDDFLQYLTKRDQSASRWRTIGSARPGIVVYAARLSPKPMLAWQEQSRITSYDPPLADPGMMTVRLDAQGRLVGLAAVPPDKVEAAANTPVDWSALFRDAALDPARFHPAKPFWTPSVASDTQAAWEGTLAEQPDLPLRVEAAARGGRPVSFLVLGPWDNPRPASPRPRGIGQIAAEAANLGLELAAYAVGLVLALRNLRRGRGDRKAAFRLAAFLFVVTFLGLFVRADYRGFSTRDFDVVKDAAGHALFTACTGWLLYIALEPYVRRKWPHLLISWTRLLSGRFRDPMVGRDVLLGTLGGLVLIIVEHLTRLVPSWLGLSAPSPAQAATSPFASPRHALFFVFYQAGDYVRIAIILLSVLVLARVLLRSQFLARTAVGIAVSAAFLGATNDLRVAIPAAMLSAAVLLFVTVRRGLLSLAVTGYSWGILRTLPPVLDPSAWYFGRFALGAMVVFALALYGLVVSLGDKPLFGVPLFDET